MTTIANIINDPSAALGCLLLLGMLADPVAAQTAAPLPEMRTDSVSSVDDTLQPNELWEPLWNQMDDLGNDWGITSQNFEWYYDAWDSEAADDFVIPEGERWAIGRVDVAGFFSTFGIAATSVNVRIYDDWYGRPGNLVFQLLNINPSGGAGTGNFYFFVAPPLLPAGTYWLSVQPNLSLSSSGQWYWRERSYLSSEPSTWRNPGNGFGTGCTTWQSRLSSCGVGYSPDLNFQLIGERVEYVRWPVDVNYSKIEPWFNFADRVTCWKNCEGLYAGDTNNRYHAAVDIIHRDALGTHEVDGSEGDRSSCQAPSVGMVVRSMFEGQVVDRAEWTGEGYVMIINHGFFDDVGQTIYGAYWHMAQPTVDVGDHVQRGTQIGVIGAVGNNPHLHFEVRNFSGWGYPGEGNGYTVNDPRTYGYFDPCEFVQTHGGQVPASCSVHCDPDAVNCVSQELPSPAHCSIAGGAADLIFVVNTRDTMGDDLAAIKAGFGTILDAIEAFNANYRLAIVDYRDYPEPPYGGVDDYPYHVAVDFSNDRTFLTNGINALGVGWGADFPESIYSALIGAISCEPDEFGNTLAGWRDYVDRYIFLIGDSPPHDPEPYTNYTFSSVIDAIMNSADHGLVLLNGNIEDSPPNPIAIQSIAIGSDPDTLATFGALADATGGHFSVAENADQIVSALVDVLDAMTGPEEPPEENEPPDVTAAIASPHELWPPNHKLKSIEILDVTDPDGDPVTLEITGITQDEPVMHPDKTAPDGEGVGLAFAFLRAERRGGGNGRVYEISFIARDDKGAESAGSVTVCVPHDQGGGATCVDDGQLYDSTEE